MNDPRERSYNFIFEKLAGEPDDIVGLLAYGIYKREKIDFIRRYKDKHGCGPSEEKLSEFHEESIARLQTYKQLAETDLVEFQNLLVKDKLAALSADYEHRFREELRKTRPSWSAAVAQSFLGSVVFTIFVGFLVVLLLGWRYGVNTIAQEAVRVLTGQ